MSYSAALLPFIQAREGYATDLRNGTVQSYWDVAGQVWTIAWGLTGPDIVEGTIWTREEASSRLLARVGAANHELLALSPGPFPPGAEDALSDFVYNEGGTHYKGSTLRTYVDAGNWLAAKSELLKWEYAGGQKLAGLVNRREAEASMIEVS
jgi:lysozyme